MSSTDGKINARVLVVDDDRSTLLLLDALLKDKGVQPVLAQSPAKAQEILKKETGGAFNCALVDYRMPGMNGLELLEWILAQDNTLATILMTAEGDVALVTGALRRGVCEYVEKPFNRAELYKAIIKASERTTENRYVKDTVAGVRDVTLIHERLVPNDKELLKPPFAKGWNPSMQIAFHPAHETGGDFVNCFPLPEDRLLVVAGDVSGHDLKAGFIASYFQGICRGMIEQKAGIDATRAYFNKFLHHEWNRLDRKGARSDVITSLAVCFLLVDFQRMTLTCLNNGFPLPCLCDEELGITQLGQEGPPLGWFADAETQPIEVPLPQAGSVILSSDGLAGHAETNGANEFALAARLLDLSKNHDQELEQQADDILCVRLNWRRDDATEVAPIVCFHRTYPGNSHTEIDPIQEEWKQSLKLCIPTASDDWHREILLCCREALLNALLHGSSSDPSKRCTLTMTLREATLLVRVSDQGSGYQNLPEKDEQETPGMHVSLGLRIIDAYTTRLWTQRNGATLFMEFALPPDA